MQLIEKIVVMLFIAILLNLLLHAFPGVDHLPFTRGDVTETPVSTGK